MISLNHYSALRQSLDTVTCVLLGLSLLCFLAFIACLIWALWKWLDWKLCERAADRFLFYRKCRQFDIGDSDALASPKSREQIVKIAEGYGLSALSLDRLGKILDQEKPRYEALRRHREEMDE